MLNIKNKQELIELLKHAILFLEKEVQEKNNSEEEMLDTIKDDKFFALKELTHLRSLAKSTMWPAAIPNHNKETKEEEIAEAVIATLIKTDLLDKNILELGCKEGHNCRLAKTKFHAKKSVGFDPKQTWEKQEENVILTNSWEEVSKNGPYDIIFSNDIIDHDEKFDNWLEKIRPLRNEKTKIYIRCHPWCSRHGANIHDQLNKAYIHLVFSDDELFSLGISPKKVRKFLDPIKSYMEIFQKAGFSVVSTDEVKSEIENFFEYSAIISDRIKSRWKKTELKGEVFPREFMELEVVDFTLI